MTEGITDRIVVVLRASSGFGAFAMRQPENVDITEIFYRPTRQEL